MPATDYPLEVSATEAKRLLDAAPGRTLVVDVREPDELAVCQLPGAEHIPMRQIPEHVARLPRDKHILVLCHAGARSLRVTQFLRAQGLSAVSNIAGGIDSWATDVDPSLPRY